MATLTPQERFTKVQGKSKNSLPPQHPNSTAEN